MQWDWQHVPEQLPGGDIWVVAHVAPYEREIKWVAVWQERGGNWWLGFMLKSRDNFCVRLENPSPALIQEAKERAQREIVQHMARR